ncbi:ATP synthase complex subunit h domain-containing protein [Sarocladium implicatum]|nr:ATP synthase complex subunit h domain-containing protein [Sarocladium implicatum]
MFTQLSRASRARSAIAVAAKANGVQVRSFIAPTVSRRADFVQELYLKELKAYKIPPVKESDSVGQVQTFNTPATPKSPEEGDLAGSLKEYESMAVEIEGQDAAAQTGAPAALPDWLETEEEEEAHH